MANVEYDIAYTKNGPILVPSTRIVECKLEYDYKPCCGYAYTLAAFEMNTDKCVGWIAVEVLGYSSVKEWMEQNASPVQ